MTTVNFVITKTQLVIQGREPVSVTTLSRLETADSRADELQAGWVRHAMKVLSPPSGKDRGDRVSDQLCKAV